MARWEGVGNKGEDTGSARGTQIKQRDKLSRFMQANLGFLIDRKELCLLSPLK
jgi:hypothetical protein